MTRPGPSTFAVGRGGRRLAVQRDLLGSHADGDLALVPLGAGAGHRRCGFRRRRSVIAVLGRAGDLAGEQVRLAEEVGDERGARQVVELRGRAHLLDRALVHDGDGVGHGHGLLLVVRHVEEREADLLLDAP